MINKLAHGIILAFFGVACWFAWASFKMPSMVRPGLQQPAFTRLCVAVGPVVVIALAVLATAYCVWVWFRRGQNRSSWVAFLATATSALLFVMLPSAIATSLAFANAVNQLAVK